MDLAAAGATLAARHRRPATPDPEHSLVNYAESSRTGDWSLRSALVRLAQPEPVRAGAVLELIRRCDGALRPYARLLERTAVWCDRSLSLDDLGHDPREPYADARAADLARLARSEPDGFDVILGGYTDEVDLGDDERAVIPLLAIAVDLDELADTLAEWAAAGAGPPPLVAVDEACRRAFDALAAAGVPRETRPGPPPGRRRSG